MLLCRQGPVVSLGARHQGQMNEHSGQVPEPDKRSSPAALASLVVRVLTPLTSPDAERGGQKGPRGPSASVTSGQEFHVPPCQSCRSPAPDCGLPLPRGQIRTAQAPAEAAGPDHWPRPGNFPRTHIHMPWASQWSIRGHLSLSVPRLIPTSLTTPPPQSKGKWETE